VNKKKIARLSRLDNLKIDLLMLIEESKTKDSKQKHNKTGSSYRKWDRRLTYGICSTWPDLFKRSGAPLSASGDMKQNFIANLFKSLFSVTASEHSGPNDGSEYRIIIIFCCSFTRAILFHARGCENVCAVRSVSLL